MNEMNELPDNTNDPSKGLPNDGGADLSKDTHARSQRGQYARGRAHAQGQHQ